MKRPRTDDEADIDAIYRDRCPNDLLAFADGLIIPSAHGPKLFAACMAPFQRMCFESLAPSLMTVRDGHMPGRRRFWIERTKKSGKDSDLGVCLLWLLSFPTRPLYLQVGAADQDQAAIVKRRITDLIYHNEWLAEFVEVQRNQVRHRGDLAMLDILAADVAGSHGETPDVLVVNELSHVTRWEFVENLLDNADGVPRGVVVIATNAGFRGSKADVWRQVANTSPAWDVHLWQQPAPWLSQADIEDAKRRNPTSRFNRLWYGRWASGKGDALNEDDIDRCFSHGLKHLLRPQAGWRYVAGLDLGVTHDHSGLVVIGINEPEQRMRVAWFFSWRPPDGGEVDLIDVEERCLWASRNYRIEWFGYDPSQAKLMAQRLARRNVPMREVSFASPKNLSAMATALVQLVEAGKLECYDDKEGTLRRDFGKLCIVEKTRGCRLEAVSDEHGHADVATALVICLPKAVEIMGGRSGLRPDDDIGLEDDGELTEEELDEMPAELRDIYDLYDEPVRRRTLDEDDEVVRRI